jgi:dGTPase
MNDAAGKLTIRQQKEKNERRILSPYAVFSDASKGRQRPEEACDIRTCFERDRDRILYCKSFRRLKDKTQVFIAPASDHYRTRLTHTLEVAQIARTIAGALFLNDTLTEAIALGHDLGHTPFGHSGEEVLSEICPFEHNIQSLRIVEELENGTGLNLTWEVRDGILNHCSGYTPSTLEGKIVYMADKIAYINHDMDDAVRSGILTEEDFPQECIDLLGATQAKRIDTMIRDIVTVSSGKNDIMKTPEIEGATLSLRQFLFDNLYYGSEAKTKEEAAKMLLRRLFDYYEHNAGLMPEEYVARIGRYGKTRSVCDYIAGMSDNFAVGEYTRLFGEAPW